MEFGKRHDATDTTDFCPLQLVTDLLRGSYLYTGSSCPCMAQSDVFYLLDMTCRVTGITE